jgi:uncharacterized membrane protein YoaK (UPF0700 family)
VRVLLVLTFTTGLVDAVSYLGLGRVFTANMTGNVVLLGFGVAGSPGLPVIAPTISLVAFILGSIAGGGLAARVGDRSVNHLGWALAGEVAFIALAALVAAVGAVTVGGGISYLLIALLGFAMGVRNATVRRIGIPDLTTTVLTMTVTAFASDISRGGWSGEDAIRRLSAITSMFLGALVGALLLKASLALPLALAAGLALLSALVYIPSALRNPS